MTSKQPQERILSSVEEAIEEIRAGRVLIVVDDEDRENEGDFIVAGEKITPEIVNFMAAHGRGLICAPLPESRCEELNLPMMVTHNTSLHETPFTVSVDLTTQGCTTGISVADRAKTIRALVEIMNEDGTMARLPQLHEIAKKHGLKIVSIADLIAFRLQTESIVEKGETVDMPTQWGHFRLTPFRQKSNGLEHFALTKGEWAPDEPVLVRVHSSCMTGDILGSYRCDCGPQLHEAMQMIEREGKGAVVYLNQEGRGIGLCNKIKAYKLQEQGYDTAEANLKLGFQVDERDYGVGAGILREIGIKNMRLMTNNPLKRAGLEGYGLRIVENVPIVIAPNPFNEKYLKTKETVMGHRLGLFKK